MSNSPYDGWTHEHGCSEGSILEEPESEAGKVNRTSITSPSCYLSHNLGTTDLSLSDSRYLPMQNMGDRGHSADNPYHWTVPTQSRNSNVSVWVNASWTRTNEIVRQQAGTLSRSIAIRRPHRGDVRSKVAGAKSCAPHQARAMPEPVLPRSFSFEENGEQRANLNLTLKEREEKDTVTRVDSGVIPSSIGKSTHSSEEPEERPRIARTFSEILGANCFIPTALLEGSKCSGSCR